MTHIKTSTVLAAGLIFGALPAAAQTAGLCGGSGENGQWIGGDEAASDISTSPDYLEQMAIVLLRNEYVALFSLSETTDVRLEAQGRGGGDPVIELRDGTGNIVLSDDDSGGGGASRAESTLDAGTYCLAMTSYDGAPMTGFIRVSRSDQEALTEGVTVPDVSPQSPNSGGSGFGCSGVSNYLGDGQSVTATLADGGSVSGTASVNEINAWGFTLDETSALSILAENQDADPVITLYDSNGGYIAENDDYDGWNSRIDMIGGLEPGEYCIEVRALSSDTLPITVSVVGFDAEAARVMQFDRGEASPPLDGSHPVTDLGVLPNRLRQDVLTTEDNTWFAFEMDAAGLVVLETASGGNGDSVLVLFDDFGRQLARNDDANASLDSQIIQRLNPGVYLVGVAQLNTGTQEQIRVLFERWVPAQ